jgi:diguanylate cyclase (GGDEF)-like protein/PAS domain S-box-containing protein
MKRSKGESKMEFPFYKAVLDHLYDGVYFVDKDRKIVYWNSGAEKLTGFSCGNVVGRSCFDNILNHTSKEGTLLCNTELCPLAKALKDGSCREEELYLQNKDGHRIAVSVRIAPMRNAENEIIGAVEIFSDNSPKFHLLEQLTYFKDLSLIDPLTRLGNRRIGEIELSTRITQMNRLGKPSFGMLFADIDHFKRVNDQYGHDTGDKVIQMVAKTIQNGVGARGIAFRWGGEEFLAIINASLTEQVADIAERVRLLTEQSVFRMSLAEIRVTVSIGAALAELGDTDETLVKRVDELMYASKKSGRNRVTMCNHGGRSFPL